jgi:peptidoglycan hydrolase-like protein with peptidoglycan-binding domain
MIKKQYLKEIAIAATQQKNGALNTSKDVKKVQSWLNLYAVVHPSSGTSTSIDGDFGSATEAAVKNFQKAKNLSQTGIVDAALFSVLSQPLLNAFTNPVAGNDLRTVIVNTAMQHLSNTPFELTIAGQSNSGPWVRSYMDGNEGASWLWCMGFVQTILDQAASKLGKDFRTLMPLSYSCDTVATTGIHKGILSRYTVVRNNPSLVKPGDIFLLQQTAFDWVHTGIITAVNGDLFETVEGNTNNDGSSNGNGVYKRVRNFQKSKLDVLSIQSLV